jgi:ADP-heptose:LPS heptosyltransferase
LNLTSSLSIEQTVYALKASKGLISGEGLLSHICQSLKKKCITIFTCTSPEYVSDVSLIGKTLFPIISPVACQGCRHGLQIAGTTVICPRQYICTKKVTVESVWNKYLEVFVRKLV